MQTSNITHNSATLTWTKSAGATSHEALDIVQENFIDIGDVATYNFTGLSYSTEYNLIVRAKNAHGTSNNVFASVTTLPNPAPPIPTNLRTSNLVHNRVTLHWDSSTGATSYEVSSTLSETGTYISSPTDVGDVTSYTFTGLTPNTEYVLAVSSVNSLSTSTPATQVITTLPSTATDSSASAARDSADEDDHEPYAPKPTPTLIHDTLNHLPPGIQVSNWRDGAQGRQVNHIGVGRADIIERGIVDAVDLWGHITPGIEVCFAQPGRIVFLDAAYMPRQLFDLPAHQRDGMSCAMIDRAGTVVLLRGDSPLEISPEPSQPQILSDCEVWPWENVNFRESPPDGPVISVTGLREWLPASEKRDGYFKVRRWATEGWISGDYVYTRGDCGN